MDDGPTPPPVSNLELSHLKPRSADVEAFSSDPRVQNSELASHTPELKREPPLDGSHVSARVIALIEVILCSDVPTQIAVGATLAAIGLRQGAAGALSSTFVVALSLGDTVFLLALVLIFLRAHGENPRDVFFGTAPVGPEIRRGIALIFVALILAAAVMLTVQLLAPRLHNVTHNPLQDLIRTPLQAALFGIVVVVAGGVREELQRAFILRRFERHLGGAAVGVVVWSIAFGAFHKLQGLDAAIATGILGAFWGVVYLWRRSVVAPMVSHAGFNLLEVLLFVTTWR